MKLLLKKPFKSIRSLDPMVLPDFVVLTGVNGAGKSHFLEAIENGSINIEGIVPNEMHGPRRIRRFDAGSIVTQDTGAFSGAQISSEVASNWESLSQICKNNSEGFYATLRTLPFKDVEKMTPRELMHADKADLIAQGFPEADVENGLNVINMLIKQYDDIVMRNFIQADPGTKNRIVEKMRSVADVPVWVMTQDEFYDAFPENWQQIDLFQQSFSRMFSSYQRAWRENELRARGREKGEGALPLSDEQFLEKNGPPPWDFLNRILEVAGLDFRINRPSKWEDRPYEPMLQDARREINIKFGDLSSGERILMSFALCLYHVNDGRSSLEYPQVLLFDEIDAPLHPSMTSSLLKTIQQTLVMERGIKVILTTHSPSTVALSPEASIYIMQKNSSQRMASGSRDAALGILTAGVPTLSVRYENRRQAFVESRYDVEFYGALYQLARSKLLPEISISFIASGAGGGHGNCEQVIAISTLLRKAGNRTVFGLIDWDLKNKSSEYVHVVGENDRYAIENYILDPLLIGLLLLRENFIAKEDFGFLRDSNYLAIAQSESAALERIARRVVLDLERILEVHERVDLGESRFDYCDGISFLLPRWLALLQGHRLEEVLKKTYPALNRYRGEADLKIDIINKVLNDRPGLMPSKIVDALKAIQMVG